MRDLVAMTARTALALCVALCAGGVLAAPAAPPPSVDGRSLAPRPTPAARKAPAKAKAAPVAAPAPEAAPDPARALAEARALREAGKPAEAEALLRPLLALPGVDPDVHLEMAACLSDQSKDAEAAGEMEIVVHARPEDDAARLRLADLYVGLDEADSALEHYQAVQARRPGDPALMRRVGLLLLDMDRGAEALPLLEAYSALVPGDDEILLALQRLYTWNDRPADARRVLQERVRLNPDDPETTRQLAESLVDAEKEKEAIPLYERLVARQPDDLAARRALGELYEWNGAPRKALDQYEAILDARPFDAEVRARALSLSSDLGLGQKARLHGYMLRSNEPRYRDLARQTMMIETGFGTWAGVQYTFFHEKDRMFFHGVGPRAAYQAKDWAVVGAFYQFRHLRGPNNVANGAPTKTILGHAVGVFTDLLLPAEFRLSAGVSFNHYDTGFDSGNGFLTLSRDFDRVSLSLEAERTDLMGSIGDVMTKVTANNLLLNVDSEPVDRFLLHFSGGWGMYSDRNQFLNGAASIGWRPIDLPRLELWYEYTYQHAKYTEANYPRITYFAPDHYHAHGPLASFLHAPATWFAYGLDLHLWHVYGAGDNALLIQYTPKVTFRPGLHHLLQASYQRTDTLWGQVSTQYQDNLLLFTYAYEF